MKKIAVILCGSGYRDGSEIRESVAVLWSLSRNATGVQCFAPEAPQADVVNCLSGQVAVGESRNILVESARIARGQVLALSKLNPSEYDGLIIPGGFGAAKNLCSFAREGSKGLVRPELQKILEAFYAAKKPIGVICIAPAILALGFRGKGFELTVGATCEASQEIEKLGHRHKICPANECYIDHNNRVVSTPAYMYDGADLNEVFVGIDKLVTQVVKWA